MVRWNEMSLCRCVLMTVSLAATPWFAASAAAGGPAADSLLNLSIEQLGDIRVTSVSRQSEELRDAPASVFVITADDIRRSGVTSLPEALRLAPGVEVARRGADAWSVSIRGFNGQLSNKLLVLIDGRSVYSPLYAGVFWDVQDTMLRDIDRIEVISGPGGTLWGANAVNGVINIITRSAADTQGRYADLGGGNEQRGFGGFRWGGKLGDGVSARAFVKYFDNASFGDRSGAGAANAAQMGRAGFRIDAARGESSRFTLQGDAYGGKSAGTFQTGFTLGTVPAGTFEDYVGLSGGNVLGRWNRQLGGGGDLQLQVYYDHTRRDIPSTYKEERNTLDGDFQHHFSLGARNDVVWGAVLRRTSDRIGNTLFATFQPDTRTDRTSSVFFQDKIDLHARRYFLTLGSKFEHNDYTGFEDQPNVRFSWLIDGRRSFWAAISRAVRIPSRLDADLQLTSPITIPSVPFPVYVRVNGSRDFQAERLLAYEAGHRFRVGHSLAFDITVFDNHYDRLETIEAENPIIVAVPPLPYAILPNYLANGMEGRSTGGTLVVNWQPDDNWRLRFEYSHLSLELWNKPGSRDATSKQASGNSPENQLAVQVFADLGRRLEFYVGLRHVGELPNQRVDAYTAVDTNLRWQIGRDLNVSFAVRNLTHGAHLEFGSAMPIDRTGIVKLAWTM